MSKTITLCGSMAFFEHMLVLQQELMHMGYCVLLPEDEETEYQLLNEAEQISVKRRFIDDHLAKIKCADAVLIVNDAKHGIAGYVGANTLMEVAFAYVLAKPIFILNQLGEQGCRLEVLGMRPQVLDSRVDNLIWKVVG